MGRWWPPFHSDSEALGDVPVTHTALQWPLGLTFSRGKLFAPGSPASQHGICASEITVL